MRFVLTSPVRFHTFFHRILTNNDFITHLLGPIFSPFDVVTIVPFLLKKNLEKY